MLKSIFYVALGSAIGGVCRYLLQQAIQRRVLVNFPYGTMVVNILGCFVIGIVFGLAARGNVLSPMARLFLATGICGGFTTFSSFMLENYSLMNDGAIMNAFLYVALSLFVGYVATIAGIWVVKLV